MWKKVYFAGICEINGQTLHNIMCQSTCFVDVDLSDIEYDMDISNFNQIIQALQNSESMKYFVMRFTLPALIIQISIIGYVSFLRAISMRLFVICKDFRNIFCTIPLRLYSICMTYGVWTGMSCGN